MIQEQAGDSECQNYALDAGRPQSMFDFNEDGVLVRRSPWDGAIQTVVPASLRDRVIQLSHKPLSQGHPGKNRLYQTLRERFYWPFMASDAEHHVATCRTCVQATGVRRKKQHKTRLFPPTGPLQDVAMDLLGPLPKTRLGNQYVLVITDRFSKLTRAIPMAKTTAPFIAAVFLNNWIMPYGIPDTILTDNGSQFIAEFFKTVCHILGVRRKTTTAYHPQTNGQAERYNKTIAKRLRHYVSEHQNDWDQYVQPLTYAYNAQVHATTGLPPFNLTIARPPPCPILDNVSSLAQTDAMRPIPSSRTMRARILRRLSVMFDMADSKSSKARAKYKRYADRSVVHTPIFEPGSFVFIMRPPTEGKTAEEKEKNIAQSKLRFKTTGPYEVISSTNETVTVKDQGVPVVVSVDRCVPDPRTDENEQDHVERLYDADDITVPEMEMTLNDNPTDQNEFVLRQGHEPEPEPKVDFEKPICTQVLSRTRRSDGTYGYQVRYSDTSIVPNISVEEIPKRLIDDFLNQEKALTTQPTTTRRKGRPRLSDQQPLLPPQSSSAQPSAILAKYQTNQQR